ncbi:hypothetical protein BS47DRAFT_1391707 [Hydnum rufescens UP504]|uniref:Uncharacterized protein n=1 Tax=Hydnum rufescens UP504 TaxID=1448309 RepID=A0A9P6B0F4_9AGAM|nr:hypothetical protein BS47DRAFT_1391707 [Hydnum rufescens UP504]
MSISLLAHSSDDSGNDDAMDEIQPLMQWLSFGGMNTNIAHPHPSNPFHMTPEPPPPPPHPEPPNPVPPAPMMKFCSCGHMHPITSFTVDKNGVLHNQCENCCQGDAQYQLCQQAQDIPAPPATNNDSIADQDGYQGMGKLTRLNYEVPLIIWG